MIRISPDQIKKWRIEIKNSEDFRDKHFGKNKFSDLRRSGENIDYFESGINQDLYQTYNIEENFPSVNVIHPIVKNIIPSLYWKNPYISVTPKRKIDEDSAPYCSALLNYYLKELDLKGVNRQIIFDAYVLGMGICKIGYSTKFGSDIEDKNMEKDREKKKNKSFLEKLGLRKPKEEEKEEFVEPNEYIRYESPYVVWVNPFDFLIDPQATSIHDARWCGQRTRKILSSVKRNTAYSNTKNLNGTPMEETLTKDVPETEIDEFKYIDLYELHYKTDDGIYILTLAREGEDYRALLHEKSIYKMDGFQYEILMFNKHNHKLYPKSDVDVVKGLQDRINITFENILDQIDKYVPKLFVDETGMTVEGKSALLNGDIGAVCYTNRDPNTVLKEGSFTQLKGDLVVFMDRVMDVIMLETGLTKAQLMGMTTAETATEAQIGQAGQNLRMSDKLDFTADFASKQARKLWQVLQQFVDLEEIQLITGEGAFDDITGLPKYGWMPDITSEMADKLAKGEYRFDIEAGSIEKPDLPVLRSQLERVAQLLAQQGVIQAFQQQGYKIELAEFAKRYLQTFPNLFPDIGKVIKPITEKTTGLLPPQMQGGPNMASQNSPMPPNIADILSGQAGEKGQGFGIA